MAILTPKYEKLVFQKVVAQELDLLLGSDPTRLVKLQPWVTDSEYLVYVYSGLHELLVMKARPRMRLDPMGYPKPGAELY